MEGAGGSEHLSFHYCHGKKLSRWESVVMRKCRVGNRLLGKCRGGKFSWWEIISWDIVVWELSNGNSLSGKLSSEKLRVGDCRVTLRKLSSGNCRYTLQLCTTNPVSTYKFT